MTVYIIIFLVCSFIGWILDSTYCSIGSRKFVFSGYFKYIPLCPIYGFGGLLILRTFILLQAFNPWITIGLTTLLVILLEYIGGWFCDKILDEKLWDYTNRKGNINGYVTLQNCVYWLILVAGVYFLLSPFLGVISSTMLSLQKLIAPYDVYISVPFIIASISLTIHTRDVHIAMRNRRFGKLRRRIKQRIKEKINKLN